MSWKDYVIIALLCVTTILTWIIFSTPDVDNSNVTNTIKPETVTEELNESEIVDRLEEESLSQFIIREFDTIYEYDTILKVSIDTIYTDTVYVDTTKAFFDWATKRDYEYEYNIPDYGCLTTKTTLQFNRILKVEQNLEKSRKLDYYVGTTLVKSKSSVFGGIGYKNYIGGLSATIDSTIRIGLTLIYKF